MKTIIKNWVFWLNGLSWAQKLFPLLLSLSYYCIWSHQNQFHHDQKILIVIIMTLAYSGQRVRGIFNFLLPFILTAIVYDSQRFYSNFLRGAIRVKEPYFFDLKFFGIDANGSILTPNEWFQLHTHPLLDLWTGFAYLFFILIFILIAAYFVYWVHRSSRISWAFFWLNVIGYTTYYWYPAAPPWYVALYGLGPAKLDVSSNPAGCARFDQILGTSFFSEMYGRSADVFGAIPSLHVAYPLLAIYFAFQYKKARLFSIFFYISMCFSAVYLNHHYVLDVLLGSLYAIVIGATIFHLPSRLPFKIT